MIRITALLSLLAAPAATSHPLPPPPPTERAPRIEDLPSSIQVRQFMRAIMERRFADAEAQLLEDTTLTLLDGSERRGPKAVIEWFSTDFAGHVCGFWLRGDPGHLNDNSIYYGIDDGFMAEYRPFGCAKPLLMPEGGQRKRLVLRFTTTPAGIIGQLA
ncbi:MAG TPA: hypothetical protein VJM13_02575, partial [Sphingopyxis sp.]|nr:hypothetical protein [Sphingopyxis sp.]